jgi:endonuclease/exonuclease/phosphatase family metal-dependent hydrolase
MKLITLNTWGGRAGKEGLLSFFDKYKCDTDVFCLQEIWSAPHEHLEGLNVGGKKLDHKNIMVHGVQDISTLLCDHNKYFRPHLADHYGIMILIDNKFEIVDEGEVFVYKQKGYIPDGDVGNHARNIQYVTTTLNGKPITIINFHGLWNGKGKTDTEDRLNQSKNIIEFTKTLKGDFILCGDFNLLPSTESLKLFESHGLRNLIKEYNITSTRTSFYEKPEKFADYVFATEGIKINDFKVLPDEISDHAPIFLDFDII